MRINEDFWGDSEDRTSLYDGTFETTDYDLMTAMNNDRIPLNEPLDTSISPWSINADADVAQLWYPIFYRDGETTKILGSIYNIHNEDDITVNGVPIYFAVPHYSGNGGFAFNWFARNGYSQAVIQDTTANTLRDKIYPVTKFDYGRLAHLIRLRVADYKISDVTNESSFWASGVTTLDAYITNQIDRPILGIDFVPYYATYEDYPNNREQIQIIVNSIALKDPMPIQGEGLNGYDIDFIDDYMTLNKCNADTINYGTTTIGTYGSQAFYTLGADSVWATNAADSIQYNYGVDRNNLAILHTGGSRWSLEKFWTGAYTIYYRTELRPESFDSYDDLKDYILTQAAYLGTWFCTDATDIATTEPGSTSNWYLGEIGENGITTGRYEQGANTANLNNSTWVDPWEESGWSGRSEDPTNYDTSLTSDIQRPHTMESFGTKTYLMTDFALKAFLDLVTYDAYVEARQASDMEDYELGMTDKYGTTNPLELLDSVTVYPMDMRYQWGGESQWSRVLSSPLTTVSTKQILIGNTTVTMQNLDGQIHLLDVYSSTPSYAPKQLNYFQKYHCFLDYAPYCSAELYVPFCGSVSIDPELFAGHKVGVIYDVDILSGSCKAFIMRDNLVVDTVTGNIGARVAINAQDFGQKINAEIQTNATIQAQKWKQAKNYATMATTTIGGLVAGTAMGGPVGGAVTGGAAFLNALNNVVSTEKQMQNAEYALESTEIPFKQLLTGSGFLSQWDEFATRLMIYRPTFLDRYGMSDFGNYGHTVGFGCLKFDTLSNYSGLTVCSSADLTGCSATDKEISMIKQALQTGVYLP